MENSNFENKTDLMTKAKELLEWFLKKIGASKDDKFSFLLIGRTGVGKSSTVNALMGEEVAKTNDSEPETMDVTVYEAESFGVKFNVIDTPGLCDDLSEVGNDELYINKMIKEIKEFHSLWFVTFLGDTRVSADEKNAIRLITEAFSSSIWERAVIIFTNSRQVPEDEFTEKLETRTRKIREEIGKHAGIDISNQIPAVAIETRKLTNPDGKEWLGELYTTVFERISENGALPFLMATAKRINKNKKQDSVLAIESFSEQPQINLTADQKKRIQKKIDATVIPGLAATGASIGFCFGPVGAVVGGIAGATIGLIAWLWD